MNETGKAIAAQNGAKAEQSLDISEIQKRLAAQPIYTGAMDSLYGPQTRRSIQAALQTQGLDGWRDWPKARLLTAARQYLCTLDGIDAGRIDGLEGPQTRHVIEIYEARLRGDKEPETWRDAANAGTEPAPAPATARTLDWPRQKDASTYFGRPGENQMRLALSYPMRLAWDTSTVVHSTLCHEKVHDAAARVLTRVLDHYGDNITLLGLDLFGGCLNVRKMRGGSAWCMHSWGIGFDFDPARNRLRWGKDKAAFARPEYAKWFDLWEEEGAISLGRLRNYDWMHVQFARL